MSACWTSSLWMRHERVVGWVVMTNRTGWTKSKRQQTHTSDVSAMSVPGAGCQAQGTLVGLQRRLRACVAPTFPSIIAMNKDAIYHNFHLFCCLIEVARQWWFLIFVRRVFVSKINSNSIAFKWLTPTHVRTNFLTKFIIFSRVLLLIALSRQGLSM